MQMKNNAIEIAARDARNALLHPPMCNPLVGELLRGMPKRAPDAFRIADEALTQAYVAMYIARRSAGRAGAYLEPPRSHAKLLRDERQERLTAVRDFVTVELAAVHRHIATNYLDVQPYGERCSDTTPTPAQEALRSAQIAQRCLRTSHMPRGEPAGFFTSDVPAKAEASACDAAKLVGHIWTHLGQAANAAYKAQYDGRMAMLIATLCRASADYREGVGSANLAARAMQIVANEAGIPSTYATWSTVAAKHRAPGRPVWFW